MQNGHKLGEEKRRKKLLLCLRKFLTGKGEKDKGDRVHEKWVNTKLKIRTQVLVNSS